MRRRRWLWLLVPAAMVGGVASMPTSDDFGDFARDGTPVAPEGVSAVIQDPPRSSVSPIPIHPSLRVRAWRLPSAADGQRRLESRGFGVAGSASVDDRGPEARFRAKWTAYVDPDVGTEATLVESTKLPPGVGCVVIVQEPSGLGAAWRRFVARTKRGLRR